METDVVDLRDFYASPLGTMVATAVNNQIRNLWPNLQALRVLGMGYPLPYLTSYLNDAAYTIAFMPAQQGVIPWPIGQESLTALVEEIFLPLADQSVDRILLIHQLEHAQQVRPFLREIWRVLTGDGRILVVVPNRRSLWARRDATPLGYGQPYTMTQLSYLLRDSLFTPVQWKRALYSLPSHSPFLLALSNITEKITCRFLQKFSGVVCIEAVKQVYISSPVYSYKRRFQLPKVMGIQPS